MDRERDSKREGHRERGSEREKIEEREDFCFNSS